jgi:hypothetical protein
VVDRVPVVAPLIHEAVVVALIFEAEVVALIFEEEVGLTLEAEEEVLVEALVVADGNRGGKLSTCNYLSGGLLLIQCPFRIFQSGVPANVDTRLTDNSQDSLVNALRSLRIKPNDLPVRPGFGTEGRPIKLRANFFPIKVRSSTYYEYDVALSPVAGTAVRRVKRRIFQLAEQSSDWERFGLKNTVAHDHSAKLISPKPLPQPLSICIPYYDEEDQPKAGGKEYTLTISFIQKNDLSALLRYFGTIAHLELKD